MLKPLLFVSAVVLFGITASSTPGPIAAGRHAGPRRRPRESCQAYPDKSQARAKEIYAQDCALCHGDNGNGKTDIASGMGLTLDDWSDPATLANKQDQDLFNVIRNGKGKMPAEEAGRAKDDEVRELIIYIRGLYKLTPAPARAGPSASARHLPPAQRPHLRPRQRPRHHQATRTSSSTQTESAARGRSWLR